MVTPDVVVDLTVLERNIATMARSTRERGLSLRPHAKTHKMPQIARRQIAAGAVGLTVATIGEAEVFAEHGATDLFIAYPLWVDQQAATRLLALAERARLTVGADSVDGARQLARALGASASRIAVRVELDSGHHRSGACATEAVDIARAATEAGLAVTGLFTFPGHSYGPDAASSAVADEQETLRRAADSLREAGYADLELSGGSTPSASLATGATLTELRPGVYVFGDAQQWELGHCAPEDIALTVHSTVVSRRPGTAGQADRLVLDAGSKVLGSDRAAWATGYGRLPDHPEARVVALSEHHATVEWSGARMPPLGTRLRVVPNHVCLTVNLVDEVQVVRDGVVEDRWPVAARGRNS
ncbi:alanine racemase [Arthrobacter agilis]|uniref:alanine racemase n=1 Tax=Arthrobacter agilis TaxID=37921 RepID=UPI00277F9478|nr:alanine racemase [Arthrobacter agilis]MDQ0736500.1 D-serine deaminase-like pyridoxal phosphate-dependent protein [Arthrobacter agilis]